VRKRTYAVCGTAYSAFMELESNSPNLSEIAKCLWCERNIGLAYHVKTRVCMKCFRRLRTENMPDENIFGRENAEPEGN